MARILYAAALLASCLLAPTALAAIEEAADLRVTDHDAESSTSPTCKGVSDLKTKLLPLVRYNGSNVIVGWTKGSYNASTLTFSAPNFRNSNGTAVIALTPPNDNSTFPLTLSFKKDDGVCLYSLAVVAGSVLGINASTPVSEAGILTVRDPDTVFTDRSADCVGTRPIPKDKQVAYVRVGENVTFNIYTGSALASAPGIVAFNDTPKGQPIYLAKNGTTITVSAGDLNKNAKGESVPGGCVYLAEVTDGSAMGITAAPAGGKKGLLRA